MVCKNVVIDGYEYICLDNGEVLGYEVVGSGSVNMRLSSTYVNGKLRNYQISVVNTDRKQVISMIVKRYIQDVCDVIQIDKNTRVRIQESVVRDVLSLGSVIRSQKIKALVVKAFIEYMGVQAGITASRILGVPFKKLTWVSRNFSMKYNTWDPEVFVHKFFMDLDVDKDLKRVMEEKALTVFNRVKDTGVRKGLREYSILKNICEIVKSIYLKKQIPKKFLKFYKLLRLEEVMSVES